ncbi:MULTISPECIES: thioesterase family protein [unclassified Streptomyces]|uniref:thioesterase family protein n=1 Tax=unclassified Streptomyces TaxID=2593676 RepID=UPI002DD9414A|nr:MULTISPECIES: thioesterase family protein [unclassified Streptomyces]WSA92216.1 thioesterase family protein [Streptomyces sp. NBC_01795]WSB76582.1 thioesterase family protein [Streptomyces sp. NBC_01775]WSS15131.1 thioesterase family protein [Streptomyces sp. NBC_01186]WSS43974.1 thioesterase family protein [Streptomyces sp. NBC_01187]
MSDAPSDAPVRPAGSSAAVPAAVTSEFDRDTAVSRRADGGYEARLSPGWAIGKALNGGYLLAVLGRALGEALPHPDPFTITAHYLTATTAGPALVRTRPARTGRTVSTASAGLFQTDERGEEVERIRALATYGDLGALSDDVRTTAKPPAMAPREQCFRATDHPGGEAAVPELARRLDLRLDPETSGWALGAPSLRGEMRAWLGLADGREPDPLALLMAVDALPPTAFDLGLTGWVPTVELTVHVRARPAPGPLRVSIVTRNLAGGFLEEDTEIWDTADRLVAQSRQLART